jgi:uncharacterized protein YhaN
MRITGLHLLAYGHFAGCSLDFGAEQGLPPGLHVVYGHNEAGKSTTLRALSSVLFGYPHQVVDGFRHDAKDIAIGIDLLAADGRALSFVRRRRGKNALTATDGSALDEATVENFLGGVSQDVFEKVFALDHRRLREHAQALLADGGSLGFSLAEAGSGIAGLKAVLDKLKAERAALFLAAGSRPKLNQAIAEFGRLRKEARQFTVSPAEYKNHEKRIVETEDELKELRAQRSGIESAVVRLQRISKNLPLRAEHRALTQRIDALDGVPALPPGFAQSRVKAATDLDAARTDLDAACTAIEDLERRISAVAVDAAVLAMGADVENLAQRRPVIEKHEADIPRREAERDELLARAAGLLAAAELDGGAADLAQLPSALKRKAIQGLADAGKELMVKRADALKRAEAAARDLKKARDRAAQMEKPLPVDELSRALKAADRLGADITADIAKRTRALERKTMALNETLTSLLPAGLAGAAGVRPAKGQDFHPAFDRVADRIARLRELAVPPDRTEARYAERLARADQKINRARDDFERLNAELADINRRIVDMKNVGDLATEDDLKAARHERDRGWKLVRALYVEPSAGPDDAARDDEARRFAPDGRIAETYEAHVREADRTVDTLRARVKESTELAFRRRQAADLETKKVEVTEALAVLDEERKALLAEWRGVWPAGLITVQSPGEMIEWLARRNAALAAADELAEERDAVGDLVNRESEVRRALATAMAAFTGEPEDGLDALRDRARGIVDAAAQAKSRCDKADADVRMLGERKQEMDDEADRLKVRIDEWADRWRTALAEAGLPPGHTIEMATATLEVITDLDGLKAKIDGLNHRAGTMRAERDAFADAVAGIAAALPDVASGAPVETCRLLEERLRTTRRADGERRSLAEQLAIRTADRDRADDKLRRSSAALEALCAQAGVADPAALAEIERRSGEKRDAERERGQIETRVREDGDGRDVAALFAECDDVPAGEIAADLVRRKADRDDIETRVDALVAERARLQAEFDSLLGQDQAAGRAQAAAAVEAEIEDAVEAYVDLTVQETLLRAAIDVYRDRNQGPILTRAKDLFVQLTGGAYKGLRADVEGGETILIVEDAVRGSLELDALSDGTVDAVYLALRLAVVQEHNATREPLPFIADDLLLNLDNQRSEAALRTLGDLATSSQVLLFTHHAHMVELARRAVPPGVLVEHRLSSHEGTAERRRAAGE